MKDKLKILYKSKKTNKQKTLRNYLKCRINQHGSGKTGAPCWFKEAVTVEVVKIINLNEK